jgi:hypothetical protein
MNDEEGCERCMVIPDVKGNCLPVELPKGSVIKMIDKDKYLSLFVVNSLPKQKQKKRDSLLVRNIYKMHRPQSIHSGWDTRPGHFVVHELDCFWQSGGSNHVS